MSRVLVSAAFTARSALRVHAIASSASARFSAARHASTTYFTKDHEYARVEGGVAVIGVTDFAQAQLGDVVYVSLPAAGDSFAKGCVAQRIQAVFWPMM